MKRRLSREGRRVSERKLEGGEIEGFWFLELFSVGS